MLLAYGLGVMPLLGIPAVPCAALQMDGGAPPFGIAALQGQTSTHGGDGLAAALLPSIQASAPPTFQVNITAITAGAVWRADAALRDATATGGDGTGAAAPAAQGLFGAYAGRGASPAPRWGGGSASLGDVLRGMVNVLPAIGGTQARGPGHRRHGPARRDGPSSADLDLNDLARELLMSAVTVHAHGSGEVAFSIFGLGDFVAEVRRDLSGFRVIERNTGLSFSHQYVSYPVPSAERTAHGAGITLDPDDQAAGLPAQPEGIVVDQASVGDLIQRIRALTVGNVWFYVLLGVAGGWFLLRKLVVFDRHLRARRRRLVAAGARARVAEAPPILAGAPAVRRPASVDSHAHRVRRRKRTSPNALRAFLRRAFRLR